MIRSTINGEPAIKPLIAEKTVSRVWVCTACGLKLFLAQKSTYPSIRCLCGRAYWKSCEDSRSNQ